MKYSNIIGTAAISLAMGLTAPLVIADMHGDMDDMGDKTHMNDMNEEQMHHDARNQSPDASELGARTETSTGIEARPGSDGTDRDVPGEPDVGLDSENEAGY
ncbi:hypothetical protein [Halopseudomonas sp.]|jgi:hypothetical protein|uniref:hypothetical protein n=1 Tax=Halopseudomonas sp. TaxID=2901191 RepID=UPI0039E21429